MGMADVGERSAIGVIGVAQVKEVLVELIVELERRFGITIEGDDVTAAVFESLASLSEFVDGKAHEAG